MARIRFGLTGHCGVLCALALQSAGCASVTSKVGAAAGTVGTKAVSALRDQEPELFDIERQLADSAGAYIGRAVQDAVLTKASGTWDTMLLKVNEQSKVVVGNVAQGVERDLNRSIQITLVENSELVDSLGRRIVSHLLADARAGVGPLVDETMGSMERGLREKLRPVLIDLIGEAADSVSRRIRALDEQLAKSETGKGIGRLLWGLVIGLGVVVVGGGLAWRKSSVKNREAFKVARAALETTTPFHRQALEQQLRSKGFGKQADWLRRDQPPGPESDKPPS